MSQASSGERTEPATPKKRRDARERGEVCKSQELNSSVLILLTFIILREFWDYISERSYGVIMSFMQPMYLAAEGITRVDASRIISEAIVQLVVILLPMLACVVLGALLVNIAQVGFLYTTKPLQPKLSKINPMSGMKRVFSIKSLVELAKSILKLVVIIWVCSSAIWTFVDRLPSLMEVNPISAMEYTMSFSLDLGVRIGAAMLVVGAADYAFQKWKFEKDLRMTKQEIKDEWKLTEGNPEIKGAIRRKQQQMSAARMMQMVPQADVVITNPTHYAVALRYNEALDRAPVVLAKGQDFIARKIREKAQEHGVELYENKELARTLYAICDVGDAVPEDLYQAVAEVLAYIYRMESPRSRYRARPANR